MSLQNTLLVAVFVIAVIYSFATYRPKDRNEIILPHVWLFGIILLTFISAQIPLISYLGGKPQTLLLCLMPLIAPTGAIVGFLLRLFVTPSAANKAEKQFNKQKGKMSPSQLKTLKKYETKKKSK